MKSGYESPRIHEREYDLVDHENGYEYVSVLSITERLSQHDIS